MRTQRYLPGIQNGSMAKRQTRSKNSSTSKAFRAFGATRSAPRPRPNRVSSRVSNRAENRDNGRNSEGRGAKVMWMMIWLGIVLCAGFIFALRSQINTYRLGQAEERLREKLDEYTNQRKFLALDQQHALNPGESDRAGRQNRLDQLKLDREAALHSASVQRIVHRVPSLGGSPQTEAPQADQNNRLNGNGQNVLRSIKQPVK